MNHLSIFSSASFFILGSPYLYSETIAATMINSHQVSQTYMLSLEGGTITGNSLEEVCDAIDQPPSEVPGGYWCGPLAHPTYVGRTLICSDGSVRIAGRGTCENPAIPTCPNGSWELDSAKNTCSRPDFSCIINLDVVSEEKLLASIAYGEASTRDSYEEMAAIASATIRRRNASHMTSTNQFVKKYKNFSYVISDGNERYRKIMCSEMSEPFEKAYMAAENALNNGYDFANGGCFWDGYDLKSSGPNHYKYQQGFRYTNPSHNIFSAPEPPHELIEGPKGYFDTTYVSTAAHGRTIFWKLDQQFLKANGALQCR